MGALLVVSSHPAVDQVLHFRDGFEEMGIQNLRPESAVETLDKGILSWFPWLDVMELDVVKVAPSSEFGRD